ncbi:hypothetical protein FQN54_005228 [Arachnomyces sp. PD_36]|nr:hypothetical protein FQN54_005228 [Arachnomyces sp. PD_36]
MTDAVSQVLAPSRLDVWQNEELRDFSSRLAASRRIPETVTAPLARTFARRRYEESRDLSDDSLALQGQGSRPSGIMVKTGSIVTVNTVPGLDTGSSSAPSTSESIDPSVVSNRILEPDENGVLEVPPNLRPRPPRRRYQCLFHILDCDQDFEDTEKWKVHVLSHFRSHPSPTDARCPLCQKQVSSPQRDVAWEAMLDHVAEMHFQHGVLLAGSRPDIELVRYLFKLRIITSEQFKMVQLASSRWSPGYHPSQEIIERDVGSASDAVFVSANPKRERRMRAARNR